MTIESEVVDVKTLPAKTHTSEKDAERAELDKLVSGVSKLPIGQAIIIRGGTGKGMALVSAQPGPGWRPGRCSLGPGGRRGGRDLAVVACGAECVSVAPE